MNLNIKIVLLIIAYLMNFLHDIHPHTHYEYFNYSDIFKQHEIVEHSLIHHHCDGVNHIDQNCKNTENLPFHHSHLLSGHTLVQIKSNFSIKPISVLAFILDYDFISIEPKTDTKERKYYITDNLILYDSENFSNSFLRAPPIKLQIL